MKILRIAGIVAALCVMSQAQGIRFGDAVPSQTVVRIPGTSPLVIAVIPNASISFCSAPANAVPCTNKAQTYSDITLTSTCPTGTQVVLNGTSSCVGSSDSLGNWGVWVPVGIYQYTITDQQGDSYGPFWATLAGAAGISFACPSAVNGSIVAMTSTTTSSCDPNGITDFVGHWTSQSYRATGAFNGTVELTGGLADPTSAPDTNSVAFLAPTAVPTPYYLRPPASAGTVGQLLNLASQVISTNGTIDALGWLNAVTTINGTPCTLGSTCSITVGGTVEFQTNNADNANCTAGACPLQNLVAGSNITLTNTSGGNVTIAASGSAAPQALNPTAPTLANQNAAGARSITYGIQGCEDGPTCAYHSTLVTATIANANAVPSVLLTAYGDTLYGYRCYNIYVTADSGARTGVPGLIANCVWKKYLDTGTNGNSIAATNTNTTALDPFGLTIPLPGCNSIPKAPSGIDGPPCVPKAEDDEFTATFGFADAADPAFAGVNLGTSTATLTNGELIFSPQNVNAQDQARLLCMPTYPTTPYTFVATVSIINGGVSSFGGIGVTDGTKLLSLTSGSSAITVGHWTNINNNFSSAPVNITIPHDQGLWTYLKLQDTGTNIVYSHSF
jgi:hypothetical protein